MLNVMKLSLVAVVLLAIQAGDARAQVWTPQASGTSNLLEAVWFTTPSDGWAVGDAGTSLVTGDGGQTWSPFILSPFDLGDVAFRGTTLGLIVGDNGVIYRTADGGASWVQVPSGTGNNLAAVAFGAGGRAYAGGRDGTILRSVDDGASWTLVETGADRYRDVSASGMSAWFVGNDGVIRATSDGGASWVSLASGTGNDLQGVHFISATEGWVSGQNNTLRYSNDGGQSWSSRNTGIFTGPDAVFFVDANEGWAVGNAGVVYHSTNGGLTWAIETSNATNELSNVFFLGASAGWAVGDLGTIVFRAGTTAVGDARVAGATMAQLEPNRPNPFNPSTEIGFSLTQSAGVSLEIFDVAGRLVRTLVDGARYAPGSHGVVWDGTDASGRTVGSSVYFYRLTAGDFTQVRKMTLTK